MMLDRIFWGFLFGCEIIYFDLDFELEILIFGLLPIDIVILTKLYFHAC